MLDFCHLVWYYIIKEREGQPTMVDRVATQPSKTWPNDPTPWYPCYGGYKCEPEPPSLKKCEDADKEIRLLIRKMFFMLIFLSVKLSPSKDSFSFPQTINRARNFQNFQTIQIFPTNFSGWPGPSRSRNCQNILKCILMNNYALYHTKVL